MCVVSFPNLRPTAPGPISNSSPMTEVSMRSICSSSRPRDFFSSRSKAVPAGSREMRAPGPGKGTASDTRSTTRSSPPTSKPKNSVHCCRNRRRSKTEAASRNRIVREPFRRMFRTSRVSAIQFPLHSSASASACFITSSIASSC